MARSAAVPASAVFGCDYCNLEAVIALAKRFAADGRFVQYVTKHPKRDNYNITMQRERAEREGAKIIWASDGSHIV